MKTMHTKIHILIIVMAVLLLPSYASAGAFDAADDFANSESVTNQELSTQRGGFLDINGMLVNLTFLNNVSINGDLVSQIQVDLADVINAANNDLSNLANPVIIQNVDPGVLIQVQQQLDLQVVGAPAVVNNAAQFNQAAFQSVIAFY